MDKPAKVTKRRYLPGKEAGRQREELYNAAYEHIKKAMDLGYFLEAVAICESIIGDRLEAHRAQIHQQTPALREGFNPHSDAENLECKPPSGACRPT